MPTCERRIGNFKAFRLKIQESQKKFKQFSKRCVEISPSVVPPAKTVRRVSTSLTKTASARTRLNLTGDEVSLVSKLLLKFNVSHVPYTSLPEIWDKMATDMRTLTKCGDQTLL
jgi:hypothetical protein